MFGFSGRPVAASVKQLFGEDGAQRHDHAALDLLLERERVDRSSDVVRGDELRDRNASGAGVHFDLDGVRRPGGALPIVVLPVDRPAQDRQVRRLTTASSVSFVAGAAFMKISPFLMSS